MVLRDRVLAVWCFFLFFNDTATTDIYTYVHTLSLHDALPIYHPFLVGLAEALGELGVRTLRFNFPYVEAGRRLPGAAAHAILAWRAVLAEEIGRAHV